MRKRRPSTDPLPLELCQLIGRLSGAAGGAMVTAADQGERPWSERVYTVRQYLDTVELLLPEVKAGLEAFARGLDDGNAPG